MRKPVLHHACLRHAQGLSGCVCACSEMEELNGEDRFFCDACQGLQDAERTMKIQALPCVLCLHLKRFKYIEQQDRWAPQLPHD